MNQDAKELCDYLLKFDKQNTKNCDLPDFPRLHKECAGILSKNITKVIYHSCKQENSDSTKFRIAVIDLLRTWFRINALGHLTISNENVETFVKCLSTKKYEDTDYYGCNEYLSELLNANEKQENTWENICNAFDRMNRIQTEHKVKLDLINSLDDAKLQKSNFDCDVPIQIVQTRNIEKSILYLRNLPGSVADAEDEQSVFTETKENSDLTVELGYSLLCVKPNSYVQKELYEIVENIGRKLHITKIEENFLNYIWKNKDDLNLPNDICLLILTKCPFLYEKLILKLATKIIQNDNLSMSYNDCIKLVEESDVEVLINISKSSNKLICNIKSILFEILSLSNFDVRIFVLVQVVQNKMIDLY